MLQEFRKLTQGWVATVLGGILCLAFLLWGIENYLGSGGKQNLAAKINGTEITVSQMNTDYQRLVTKVKDQLGASFVLNSAMQAQIKQQALTNLVVQTALTQAAVNAGFIITGSQAASVVKAMPEFQEAGVFSKPKFEQMISRIGYTQPEFIADISQSLVLNQVATGVIGTQFVLPNELQTAQALLEQKRDFAYMIIPSKQYQKEVAQSEIKQYYEQHTEAFKAPAKLQLEYIELSLASLTKTLSVSQHDLNQYFETNGNLAKNDPKEIAKAKEILLQQNADQTFSTMSDMLADLTYSDSSSLASAAKALGLTVTTSEYFTHDGGTTSLTKNPKILAAVYSPEFIKGNANSNLIELAPGVVAVVRLKDYQAESTLPLATVQSKIKKLLEAENSAKAAKQQGEQLLATLVKNDDMTKIGRDHKYTVVNKTQVTRKQSDINSAVLALAFSIGPRAKVKVAGIQLAQGDYAIVELKNSHDPIVDRNHSKADLKKAYSENYGKVDYELYTTQQINHAKIKTFIK